ncbi:MAG: transglycosylase SLT domain-containing protein [Pseudomonadales bacterium]|nr:transglycosylase SLT domain-containing protein [Pseudomonadales bacterium]
MRTTKRKTPRAKPHPLLAAILMTLSLALSAHCQSATTEHLPEKDLQHLREAIHKSQSFKDRYAAEVWLVGMNKRLERFIKDGETRVKILSLLHSYASDSNLSPQLVLSVIEVESHFNHFALSHAGAQGLMQVMPFWKKHIGSSDDNLMDIETNLRYGCNILSHYLKLEKGDLIKALARYNGSRGKTWYPEKVLLAWEKNWFVN